MTRGRSSILNVTRIIFLVWVATLVTPAAAETNGLLFNRSTVFPLEKPPQLSVQSIQDPRFSLLFFADRVAINLMKTFWVHRVDFSHETIFSGIDGGLVSQAGVTAKSIKTIDGYFGFHGAYQTAKATIRYRFTHHSAHISGTSAPEFDRLRAFSREYLNVAYEWRLSQFKPYLGFMILTHIIPKSGKRLGAYGGYQFTTSVSSGLQLVHSLYLQWTREHQEGAMVFSTLFAQLDLGGQSVGLGGFYYQGHDVQGQYWYDQRRFWGVMVNLEPNPSVRW